MKRIVYFLICAALFACTDDDTFTGSNEKPVFTEETMLKRVSDFCNISLPGDEDWEVTSNPGWAVPMNFEGTAGTSLRLFVETNDEDSDRRDTISISLANGHYLAIPLHQKGLASSDENATDVTISAETLESTHGVGFGVNVIEESGMTSLKYNVKTTPFNLANLQQVIDKMHWDDAVVEEPLYFSRYETVTGSNTGSIANQLGVNAGIELGIKAFKFSVEAGYSQASSSSDRYYYAMQEMQHIVGSRYFRAGLMRYLAQNESAVKQYIKVNRRDPATVFQSTFNKKVAIMKAKPSPEKVREAMRDLVDNYGTHVICRGTLGGELKVSMQMKVTDSNTSSKIHAALGLSSKIVNVNGEFNMSNEDKATTSNTTISLRSYGGGNSYTIAPGTTFENFQKALKDSTKIEKWVASIKDHTSLALIDMETIPLWDLMPTEELRDSLRNYVVRDYQREQYGDNFKPDLYLINGYDVTTNAVGRGSLNIRDLDSLQIEVERCIIPELSKKELSTVVYSGARGEVNRNRGFFVGSDTRKPCKFHREKNGTFTTEEFDRLTEAAISELYVDATGDITIATKSVSDMYQTCTIDWKHDLSLLTSDWTFDSDITVTGTTNHCIHIANGTALTLDNVTVNNHIVCDGNANIILKGDTKNTVTSSVEGKAAIQAGPANTTLTIGGSGQLSAIAGKRAPGIGSSTHGECGNIVISGGEIIATGGDEAAGIGAGYDARCGNITITKDVTKVTATCGKGEECVPIGVGDNSDCGTIAIDEDANVNQVNPNPRITMLDLSKLSGDYTITTKTQLYGSTSHTIYIADNVDVQLNGATIQKVICKGNATVKLLKGTVNEISNSLVNGPANTTLTIKGDGQLNANSTSNNAGIGGNAGNIVIDGGIIRADGTSGGAGIGANRAGKVGNITINGGDIYADGGAYAAGIGSGDYTGETYSYCGNITINGGTVEAKGELHAAGIGTGSHGYCEVITIRNTVEKVTAKGGLGAEAIGNGKNGHCAGIVIEKGANVIKK